MNSLISKRNANIFFFFGAFILSLALLCASAWLVRTSLSGKVDGVAESTKACLRVMRTNGFNPNTAMEGQIKVNVATSVNIERLVYQSGVLIASCPAYTVSDYCAGAGCPTPGVSFTLKHKEQ